MNLLTRAWTWIRSDPTRTAAAVVVAVAAIAVGIAAGVFVTNLRSTDGVGSAPSEDVTPSETASADESAEPSASETPEPSASADESADPSADESAESDDAEPTPTPEQGYGGTTGAPGDDGAGGLDAVEGTWEELATMPGGDGAAVSDSVVLADGRILVVMWATDEPTPDSGVFAIYDPEADSWEEPTFDGNTPGAGTDQPFVLGNDGRVHTYNYRIDVDGDAWRTEAFQLVRETETWAGMPMAAGSDGLIYRVADDTGPDSTEFVIYDPDADTFDRSASVDGKYTWPTPVGDRLAAIGYDANHGAALIYYDPDADEWSDPEPVEYGLLDMYGVAADADGSRLYAPAWNGDEPSMWAIGLDEPGTFPVEMPPDVDDWYVDLVWHEDKLYAFGGGEAWRFTPEH